MDTNTTSSASPPPVGLTVLRGNDGRDYLLPAFMVPASRSTCIHSTTHPNTTSSSLAPVESPEGFSIVRGNDARDYWVPTFVVPAVEVALAADRNREQLGVETAAVGVRPRAQLILHCIDFDRFHSRGRVHRKRSLRLAWVQWPSPLCRHVLVI
jgi:hypothetical protein